MHHGVLDVLSLARVSSESAIPLLVRVLSFLQQLLVFSHGRSQECRGFTSACLPINLADSVSRRFPEAASGRQESSVSVPPPLPLTGR